MMQGLDIHSARIATLGERCRRYFLCHQKRWKPLNNEEVKLFSEKLKAALDEASNQICQH